MSDSAETLLRQPIPVMAKMHAGNADGETCLAPSSIQSMNFALIPTDSDSGLNNIDIGQSPLWISREIGPLAQYRKIWPERVKFLSRQHAYLYCESKQMYLKDFGSANGTELNGKKINAYQPYLLCDGDYIVFAYAFFSFRLKLTQASADC